MIRILGQLKLFGNTCSSSISPRPIVATAVLAVVISAEAFPLVIGRMVCGELLAP
jgi:hypothetical protein